MNRKNFSIMIFLNPHAFESKKSLFLRSCSNYLKTFFRNRRIKKKFEMKIFFCFKNYLRKNFQFFFFFEFSPFSIFFSSLFFSHSIKFLIISFNFFHLFSRKKKKKEKKLSVQNNSKINHQKYFSNQKKLNFFFSSSEFLSSKIVFGLRKD